jgi:integrase
MVAVMRRWSAKAPEMRCWSAAQPAVFLGWAEQNSHNYALWHFYANTGGRRGDGLSVRWRHRVPEPVAIRIGRSVGLVRYAGEGAEIVEADTKSSKPRVVDLDPDADAVLDRHKRD